MVEPPGDGVASCRRLVRVRGQPPRLRRSRRAHRLRAEVHRGPPRRAALHPDQQNFASPTPQSPFQ